MIGANLGETGSRGQFKFVKLFAEFKDTTLKEWPNCNIAHIRGHTATHKQKSRRRAFAGGFFKEKRSWA